MHDLKNKNIVIKIADKGSVVVVWEKEDYVNEVEKQLRNSDVYEEVTHKLAPHIKYRKTEKEDIWKEGLLHISKLKIKDLLGSICYLK